MITTTATTWTVAVRDTSTDWGEIGRYPTKRGAVRAGRAWAREHSAQRGYAGYGPVISMIEIDAAGEPVGIPREVRAW